VAVQDEQYKGLQGRLSDRFAPLAAPPTGSPGVRLRSRSVGWPPTWPNSRCCSPASGRARCCSSRSRPRPSPAPTTPSWATSSASWLGWPRSRCSGCCTRPASWRPGSPRPGRRRSPLAGPGRPGTAAAARQPPPSRGHHPAGQPRAARPNPPAGLGPGRRPAAHCGGLAAEPPGWPAASTPTGLTATGAASDRCSRRR
jgi:hypothetical protein